METIWHFNLCALWFKNDICLYLRQYKTCTGCLMLFLWSIFHICRCDSSRLNLCTFYKTRQTVEGKLWLVVWFGLLSLIHACSGSCGFFNLTSKQLSRYSMFFHFTTQVIKDKTRISTHSMNSNLNWSFPLVAWLRIGSICVCLWLWDNCFCRLLITQLSSAHDLYTCGSKLSTCYMHFYDFFWMNIYIWWQPTLFCF